MTCWPNSQRLRPIALAVAGLGLAYPLLIYAALDRVPASALVALLLVLAAARLGVTGGGSGLGPLMLAPLAVAAGTLALALAIDARRATLFYPVLMNGAMAAAFGASLRWGPPLVQVFARPSEPDPSAPARAYMRKVTWAWFGFLLVNTALSALSVASGDLALWTLYNGLISYGLIGLLFAGEWLVRRRVRRREGGR